MKRAKIIAERVKRSIDNYAPIDELIMNEIAGENISIKQVKEWI